MAQETKHKQSSKAKQAETEVEEQPTEDKRDQELADATDDLLEELDVLLGEVGEEFALQYVQKGGQ